MRSAPGLVRTLAVVAPLCSPAFAEQPQSRFAEAGGNRIHCLVAGKGDPVVLRLRTAIVPIAAPE